MSKAHLRGGGVMDKDSNLIDVLFAINTAIYDTFAYRLGPDEWEKAEKEFQAKLEKELQSFSPQQ